MNAAIKTLKITGLIFATLALALIIAIVSARYGDGPSEILPGGSFQTGSIYAGEEPDWSFAAETPVVEFELLGEKTSRLALIMVANNRVFFLSRFMNSTFGNLTKLWPKQALEDRRILIRIDGVIYKRELVRLNHSDEVLEFAVAELARKYGDDYETAMNSIESDDLWFFEAIAPNGQAFLTDNN